jgi:hypothetical protein
MNPNGASAANGNSGVCGDVNATPGTGLLGKLMTASPLEARS